MTSKEIGNDPRPRRTKLSQLGILFVAAILFSGSLGYLIGADAPETAPNTWIDDEELSVYKVNGIRYATDGTLGAIQNAIGDLPASGGMIVVPSGTYSWTSHLSVTQDNFALVFSDSTLIRMTGEQTMMTLSGVSNVTIYGMTLDGLRSGKSTGYSAVLVSGSESVRLSHISIKSWLGGGITIQSNSTDVKVDDCDFSDWDNSVRYNAIYIGDSRNVEVTGCTMDSAIQVYGSYSYGVQISHNNITGTPIQHGAIYVFGGAHHVTIESNYVGGFPHSGVECRGSNVSIVGNEFVGNQYGIEVFSYDAVDFTSDVSITGNVITDSTSKGVYIYTTSANIVRRVTIDSNVITNNDNTGIDIYTSAQLVTISNNVIALNGADGVLCSAASRDVVISANLIYGNTGSGVETTSAHQNAIIADNVIRANSDTQIKCASTHTLISGNLVLETPTTYAIYVSASNVSVIGNEVRNFTVTGGYGIYGTTIKDFTISDNKVTEMWGACQAIRVTNSGRFTISGNNLINNGPTDASSYGISVSTGITGTIEGNVVSRHGGYGISVSTSTAIVIDGNSVCYNYRLGIYSSGSNNISVTDNIVCSNGVLSTTNSGIKFDNTLNAIIIGNIANDIDGTISQKYGLESTGTSDYFIVIGNIFTPNVSGNYSLTGSNNIVYGNF